MSNNSRWPEAWDQLVDRVNQDPNIQAFEEIDSFNGGRGAISSLKNLKTKEKFTCFTSHNSMYDGRMGFVYDDDYTIPVGRSVKGKRRRTQTLATVDELIDLFNKSYNSAGSENEMGIPESKQPIKLKTLIEGYAWERKPGKPLPTLAEVQAEYEKNEAVSQDEADRRWNNDPVQLRMRKPTITNPTTTAAPHNFYREKITALEAQRKQLEFDMEQEAEPDGGPIADYYGEALMHIDDQIDAIRKKMSTNESIEEAQDKVSSRTHVVYVCNVEMADGSIKPGVRISVPKGNDAEKQVRDKIMARFGKDCKIRSIAKGQNPHNNDNDKDEPRWQDNNRNGIWYEPKDVKAEGVNLTESMRRYRTKNI